MGEQALVKTVANVFREICYANRDQMTAGIICAGWDKRQGGQVMWFENLFNLFSIGFVIFLQLIETLDRTFSHIQLLKAVHVHVSEKKNYCTLGL